MKRIIFFLKVIFASFLIVSCNSFNESFYVPPPYANKTKIKLDEHVFSWVCEAGFARQLKPDAEGYAVIETGGPLTIGTAWTGTNGPGLVQYYMASLWGIIANLIDKAEEGDMGTFKNTPTGSYTQILSCISSVTFTPKEGIVYIDAYQTNNQQCSTSIYQQNANAPAGFIEDNTVQNAKLCRETL